MSATETMLSDAYTDGLKYLPRRVRDSALATSGLADTTEFVIKTVDSFQLADGTYKSMKSYTVSTALYKAEDGSYVYFDGSDWRVLDNEADSDKTIIAGQTTGNNYIVVWPSGSEKAATDSASSDNNSVAKDDNDEFCLQILNEAFMELSKLISQAMLKFEGIKELKIALIGGLSNDEYFRNGLSNYVNENIKNVKTEFFVPETTIEKASALLAIQLEEKNK